MMPSQKAKNRDIQSFRRKPEVRERSETPIQSFWTVAARLDPGLRRDDDFYKRLTGMPNEQKYAATQ